jgi:putative membrane protein
VDFGVRAQPVLADLMPHDHGNGWTFEPLVVALLLLSLVLFVLGAAKLRLRAGRWPERFTLSAASFGAGWAVLAASLLSPLHALGSTLFSAHMAQHELIMVLAAPLLVAGRPLVPAIWSLSEPARLRVARFVRWNPLQSFWKFLSGPLVAGLVHAAAIWVWHVPALYSLSVRSELAHTAQHASFLLTALLFWWTIIPASPARKNAAALFLLFGTALHTSLLGALLTFSDASWYPVYQGSTAPWGLSPLEDQQLGGLIMWIPGGLSYLVVALLLAARLLQEPDSEVPGNRSRAAVPGARPALDWETQ